jgi:hexosaminidase
MFDGMPYGGFYTQDEIRDVVAYAGERFVQILPEIEMPGHCLAALASYPEFACTPGPFATATSWGVFDDVYCPTDATLQFLEDVLGEVTTLFPNQLVHVGGDEVPLTRWNESATAQAVVTSAGLSSTADLENWIASFLGTSGRRLVGWDEIAAGSKIPDATVMSWRGADKGLEAAQQGYPVIMTPIESCYFDKAQSSDPGEPISAGGVLTLEQVYAFDPMPPGLSASQAPLVLGAQGNLWTEYIATPSHAEYMAFPRALALSEAVWSPQAARSYRDFLARFTGNASHLDALGVNYRHLSGP